MLEVEQRKKEMLQTLIPIYHVFLTYLFNCLFFTWFAVPRMIVLHRLGFSEYTAPFILCDIHIAITEFYWESLTCMLLIHWTFNFISHTFNASQLTLPLIQETSVKLFFFYLEPCPVGTGSEKGWKEADDKVNSSTEVGEHHREERTRWLNCCGELIPNGSMTMFLPIGTLWSPRPMIICTYVPPILMFPCTQISQYLQYVSHYPWYPMFPKSHNPHYLCSPVPLFPKSHNLWYLCSQISRSK